MDFRDEIRQLGDRVIKFKDQILTEEATKNAMIMPFIKALGYDVFNPIEVVPEFVSDIGTKKGEKIDYAIFKDGEPTILIECKHWAQNLDLHDGQLLRYFNVSKAKFGILTNGIIYRFYTDLKELNKMDDKPFLEFNITEIKDNQIDEVKKFHKSYFDEKIISSNASELKYMSELKQLISKEFASPSADFVRHFAKQVYPSIINAKILEQFTILTARTIHQHISDLITERLQQALKKEEQKPVEITSTASASNILIEDENKIITTAEELEGFFIVKTILRQTINSTRIVYRDALSYFAILLDDNNRKTICRLYLNSSKKYIAYFDEQKKEVKKELANLDELFNCSDILLAAVEKLEKGKE